MSNIFMENCLLNEWGITEKSFDIDTMLSSLKNFEMGNGYIKVGGDFEEDVCLKQEEALTGTYINGFYDVKYNEDRNTFQEYDVKVPSSEGIRVYIEGEEFSLLNGIVLEYEKNIDYSDGMFYRNIVWESPKGRRVQIILKRIVSLTNRNLIGISYEVMPLNFSGEVKMVSFMEFDKEVNIRDIICDDSFGVAIVETKNTKFKLSCAMDTKISSGEKVESKSVCEEYGMQSIYKFDGKVNKNIKLEKFNLYYDVKDIETKNLVEKLYTEINDIKKQEFKGLERCQERFMEEFWGDLKVNFKKNKEILTKVRFNEFKLLQTFGESYALK